MPPHRRQLVSRGNARAARRAPAILRLLLLGPLLPMAACSRNEGRLTVVLDSTAVATDMEALALPVVPAKDDPRPAPPAGSAGPAADSAARLDSVFQRERASIADEVTALARLDRHGAEYARRYDALRPRIAVAESLRARRDALNPAYAVGRGAPTAGPMPAGMPMDMHHELPAPSRAGGVAAPVDPGRRSATLALRPGRWWIGVTKRGGVPDHTREVEVRAGAHDTLRLRAP